jgi:hypothetical protein
MAVQGAMTSARPLDSNPRAKHPFLWNKMQPHENKHLTLECILGRVEVAGGAEEGECRIFRRGVYFLREPRGGRTGLSGEKIRQVVVVASRKEDGRSRTAPRGRRMLLKANPGLRLSWANLESPYGRRPPVSSVAGLSAEGRLTQSRSALGFKGIFSKP